MASEAVTGQMMHENNYMGYQMQQRPDLPSTSNAPIMSTYSVEEIPQQNMPNPSMIHPLPQESLGGYPPQAGYQQMSYQNQYGSGNGPPSAQPMFSNANPYFPHQNGGNNSRMNTPTYGNSTPTYPPQNPQMGYCPPNGMYMQGQPNGMMAFQGGMSGNSTPNYPNAPGSMQQPGSHQDPNFDANGDPQYMQKQCPNGMDMNAYAHQMRMQQSYSQKISQKKAMCFSTDMLNQMAHSLKNNEVDSPYTWHQNFMEQNQQNVKSGSRKRKLSSSSSPMFNGSMQQPDYIQPTQSGMTDFQQPMSMPSDPPSVHDPNAGTSINGMRPYVKQEIKKEEDDPLRGLERMANASLESSQNKGYSQKNDTKKQEDKKVKLAKLDSLATDLNLQPEYPPNMVPRLPHPVPMPGGPPGMPPMMHMPPGMRPYFDPSMRPMMPPPNGMMYPPNPAAMVSPNMHQMQPPPYSMASPKYPPMMNRPPFMPSENMMRPGMPPEMQANWMQQQQIRQQMMKPQEVIAGGMMYSQ